MGSTFNSRLGNFARTSISLYVTIGGSLNISLGNNPAFIERKFRLSRAVRGHYYVCMASAVFRV